MVSNQDLETLSRTIYGEARGEYALLEGGLSSLIAIGNVIRNRLVKQKSWYGFTVQEVCLKPWQFSCWNKANPNYAIISGEVVGDPIFAYCRQAATGVLLGQWPDLTKGSDHYHATSIPPPAWAKGQQPKVRICRHLFYALEH